jgi:signal transduction histidine kinase
MALGRTAGRSWLRSLYGRIAIGYVVFISVFLLAQWVLLVWINDRAERSRPQGLTRAISVGLARRLADNPDLNLNDYVRWVSPGNNVFLIMRDGRVAGVRHPSDATVRSVVQDLQRSPTNGASATWEQSVYRAVPIFVNNQTVGVVGIAPPSAFEQYGVVAIVIDVVVLAIGTLIAALVIFGPVRRRIRDLQDAALRVGSGDFAARAQERGRDEVTDLARAFNSMADELSKRESALEASNRARRQLLADVSHELMTPLTAVLGHLETLQMPEVRLDDERRLRHVAIAQREARRLERVVGDLLDTARLEAGGGTLELQDVSAVMLFEQVLARHEHEAAARRVRLGYSVQHGNETIWGDAFRLEQALENVTANALRHTPDGGRVQLRAESDGGYIAITVSDSGEGIAPEHLPLIFDRFYKAGSAKSIASRGAGSGLGLSIVKAIVLRHGGTVGASSVVGKGTTITLRLPASMASTSAPRQLAHA